AGREASRSGSAFVQQLEYDVMGRLTRDMSFQQQDGRCTGLYIWPHTDETCCELLARLTPFNIGMITRNEWGSDARKVPKDTHLTGKIFTQRIERNNLTLRTRIKRLARKTIGFAHSIELHEKVITAFIVKYMFY
ncbi:MAG: insertion element protein InsB, partial [Pseudomonadota bacterium]|nr:insertion element protein InsB [Pseudomonadota bacterium]